MSLTLDRDFKQVLSRYMKEPWDCSKMEGGEEVGEMGHQASHSTWDEGQSYIV